MGVGSLWYQIQQWVARDRTFPIAMRTCRRRRISGIAPTTKTPEH